MILVKFDLSFKSGAGHAMRSFALAEELSSKNLEFGVLADFSGFDWIKEKFKKLPKVSFLPDNRLNSNESDLIFLDTYQEDKNLHVLQNSNKKIILIGDNNTPDISCDFRFDLSPFTSKNLRNCNNYFHGLKFHMTRKEIRDLRSTTSTSFDNVFVSGGGIDYGNFAENVYRQINSHSNTKTFHFVGNIELQSDPRNKFYPVGSDVTKILQICENAIVSSGTTALDLIAIGRRVGICKTAPNQQMNFDFLCSGGYAFGLGEYSDQDMRWFFNSTEVKNFLNLEDFPVANPDKDFDGGGACRIISILHENLETYL